MDLINNDLIAENEWEVDANTSQSLMVASKWTRFLAIFFIVILSILLLCFFIGWQVASDQLITIFQRKWAIDVSTGWTVLIATVLILAGYFGTICLLLLRFANQTRDALETENTDTLNRGFKSLHLYFVLTGVLILLNLILSIANLFN